MLTPTRFRVKDVENAVQDDVRAAIDTTSAVTKSTKILDMPKGMREKHVMRQVRLALCLFPWTTAGMLQCIEHLKAVEGIIIEFAALKDLIRSAAKREELRSLQRKYLQDTTLSPAAFSGYRIAMMQDIVAQSVKPRDKLRALNAIRDEVKFALESKILRRQHGIDEEVMEEDEFKLRAAKMAEEKELAEVASKALDDKYGAAGSVDPDDRDAKKQKGKDDEQAGDDIGKLPGPETPGPGVVQGQENHSGELRGGVCRSSGD